MRPAALVIQAPAYNVNPRPSYFFVWFGYIIFSLCAAPIAPARAGDTSSSIQARAWSALCKENEGRGLPVAYSVNPRRQRPRRRVSNIDRIESVDVMRYKKTRAGRVTLQNLIQVDYYNTGI